MKSKIYIVRTLINRLKSISDTLSNDKVTIYAAQASFFVITSAVPFISLLIGVTSFFLPNGSLDIGLVLTEDNVLFQTVIEDLKNAPSVSILSISAITTLWTASRGIAAVRKGIEIVYGSDKSSGYVRHRMTSAGATILFIISLTVTTVLLLFGDELITLADSYLGESMLYMLGLLRKPFLALIMGIFFSAMYVAIARKSSYVSHKVWRHIPGGIFSSVGWLLFSRLYSLYISVFPGASKVYGSLSAICLIMLWLYFCMVILLLGAELNKLFFAENKV